jgi:hypothetical protein
VADWERILRFFLFALTLDLRCFKTGSKKMDIQTIKDRISTVQGQRERLLSLLEQPNLGTLRVDVNQALEELDDLLDEFKRTIPQTENN